MSSSSRPATEQDKIAEVKNYSYYEKLDFVFSDAAPKFLRQLFRDLWQRLKGSPWEDTKSCGKKLLRTSGAPEILRLGNKKSRKEAMERGKSDLWDLPLLADIISSFFPQLTPNEFLEFPSTIILPGMTSRNLDILKTTMNEFKQKNIHKETLKFFWNRTAGILTALGMASHLQRKPKNKLKTPEQMTTESSESSQKAEEFRLAGNELFKKKKFAEAAAEYTKGIDLKEVPRELLGLLYSNRSVAKLEIKDFKAAKKDAKRCVILRPEWFRGYARFGKAYENLRKYHKALENFNLAIHHGDSSKSTVEGLHTCKLGLHRVYISEGSHSADIDLLKDIRNWNLTQQESEMQRPLIVLTWPGFELYSMGQRHLDGAEGFPLNYNKAAAFFSKAADLGDALGLFHLGNMHRQGRGFPKDTAKSHALFLKAASQEPIKKYVEGSGEIVRNLGVAEACHEIGLAYDPNNGGVEAVDVDFAKALEWYHKALEFRWPHSAINIGIIFISEKFPGFPAGFETSLEYWKLAVHLKCWAAIELLANSFFQFDMFTEAQEWFHFAELKGILSKLVGRRAEFIRDRRLERQFNAQKFADQLEKEVRESVVVGPVLKKIEDFQRKLKYNENWNVARERCLT